MKNLERIRKELPSSRRKKIESRAAELIAEEMSLREAQASPQAHTGAYGSDSGYRTGGCFTVRKA